MSGGSAADAPAPSAPTAPSAPDAPAAGSGSPRASAPAPAPASRTSMRGVAASSSCVYASCGARNTASVAPSSTTRPPRSTTTRSHSEAANPRSCVMNSMPMPRAACCSRSSSTMPACVVTSRAVVGSSQSSRSGESSSAAAIMTRCSMPPESWCGYWSSSAAARGRPTCSSCATARAAASARLSPCQRTSVSVRKSPRVRTGLMPARGSWKIIDARVRRMVRSCASVAVTVSMSPTRTDPSSEAWSGKRPRAARVVSDLPDPDSPTSATDSPEATEIETPFSSGPRPGTRSERSAMSRSWVMRSCLRCGRTVLRR